MAHGTLELTAHGSDLRAVSEWDDEAVADRYRIVDVGLATVGGGLASFALVDYLRIAGVQAAEIAVVSPQDRPHASWRQLVKTSQIPDDDPLRSDSMSRIDNIWGFPSYAVQQAAGERRLGPLWNVLTEPVLTDFFNPKAGTVYRGIDREAARIGWSSMLVAGAATLVRRRAGGGYFCLVEQEQPKETVAYRCRHLHLGLGYPAVRYLPDVQEYRSRSGDRHRVVNAYEAHEHIYDVIRTGRPAVVVIRGAGIVASRILQRLIDERDRAGGDLQVVHLFRTWVAGPKGPRRFRRGGGDGWTYQAFTFAKAAGGGQLRQKTLKLEGQERADFIRSIGGTTTANRRHWQAQLRRGRAEGFYRAVPGEIAAIEPTDTGIRLEMRGTNPARIDADFLIDCTGLDGEIRDHPLLADLLDVGGAGVNPMGRLEVSRHFEVAGTASGQGRLYASGAMTLGGYLAPVDSFWGFSHAALDICDELARAGFCARIGVRRSVSSWLRWARGSEP